MTTPLSANTHPRSRTRGASRALLWFGIFGAPAAWAVQTIVGYSIVAHYCFPDGLPVRTPAFGGTRAVSGLVVAVALVIAVLALFTAVRIWKATRLGHRAENHEQLETGEGRIRFMAFAGVLLSTVFLFAVLMNAVPLVTSAVCIA